MDGWDGMVIIGQWSSKRAPAVRIHFIRKDLMAYKNKYLWQILPKRANTALSKTDKTEAM